MNKIPRASGCRTMPKTEHGLSLIELMISLTIGLIIIAGIGYIYLGTKQSYRSQDALSRMQEGVRTAFEIMSRDIRMAGYRGCPPNNEPTGDINVLSANNEWDKNLIGQPLIGYEKISVTAPWTGFPAGVTGVVGNVVSGDALTVVHVDNSREFIVQSHTPPEFTLTANHNVRKGEVLVAAKADCSRVAVFQNTKACTIAAGTCGHKLIEHTAATPCTSGNSRIGLGLPIETCPNGTPDTFGAGSRLYRLSATTYYIATNPFGEPALYRQVLGSDGTSPNNSAEEIIEGVQDMQLAYGIDTTAVPPEGDGAVDSYVTANAVTDWSKVLGIRISLLMVSRSDENSITSKPQRYALDRNGDGDVADTDETVTPTDNLLRKVFTMTIAVKNR